MALQSMLVSATHAMNAVSQRYCCAVLNAEGRLLLWFRSEQITPCSEALSTQKAQTAYAFQADTHAIAQKLGPSGIAAVSGNGYCFLPGGATCRRQDGEAYYIGVSTENPDKDHEAAQAVAQSFC